MPKSNDRNLATQNVIAQINGEWLIETERCRFDSVEEKDGEEVITGVNLRTGASLMLRGTDGTLQPLTVSWLTNAYKQGRAKPVTFASDAQQRQANFALTDPHGNKKLNAMSRLVGRADAAGVKLNDRDCQAWLAVNYGLESTDADIPRPGGSTLRRKLSAFRKKGKDPFVLDSKAGRIAGFSPLGERLSSLVLAAALYYWSTPGTQQKDAFTYLELEIEKHNADLSKTSKLPIPSKETLRRQIQKLRCYDTVRMKFGQKEAERLFHGSGEPVLVNDILAVGLMDATTLEQIIAMDDDWQLPACKVRIVALMDLRTHAVLAAHVYAGPNRSETSIETIIEAMLPPDLEPEMERAHPELKGMFGKISAVAPDNEKALVNHGTIRSLNEAGIDVLPTKVAHPQGKAALERFFRTLKQVLAKLPATMIDPKRAKELDWDILTAKCLTLPQLRRIVSQVIAEYNVTPCKFLDGYSPAQVWTRLAKKKPPAIFNDIDHVRRILGRRGRGLLTRDGIEINGIRYRNSEKVRHLLNHNEQSTAVRKKRKDGSLTIEVSYCIQPGNIDQVDVFSELEREWISLPSTQPDYTYKLSEWEHQEFKKQAKVRREAFTTQEQRLASKAATMSLIEKVLPDVQFQVRRSMAALYLSDTVKKLAGPAIKRPMPSELEEALLTTPQTTVANGDKRGKAPSRQIDATKASLTANLSGAPQDDYEEIDFDSIIVEVDPEKMQQLGISADVPDDLPEDAGDAA